MESRGEWCRNAYGNPAFNCSVNPGYNTTSDDIDDDDSITHRFSFFTLLLRK